jgi:hypothetical protein
VYLPGFDTPHIFSLMATYHCLHCYDYSIFVSLLLGIELPSIFRYLNDASICIHIAYVYVSMRK